MTPEQKSLVQDTWHQVVPIADSASALFYRRLFEIDPEVRPLFDGVDMEAQRKKLVQALAMVVSALDRLDKLVPEIEALGRRHAGYGATDGHYEKVGAALLWTLEKGLGESWTPDTKEAWATAYGFLSGVMRKAAADSRPGQDAGPSPLDA